MHLQRRVTAFAMDGDAEDAERVIEGFKKTIAPLDRARAHFASDLVAYYGIRSARDATDAQVRLFLELRRTEKGH